MCNDVNTNHWTYILAGKLNSPYGLSLGSIVISVLVRFPRGTCTLGLLIRITAMILTENTSSSSGVSSYEHSLVSLSCVII